MHLIIVAGEKQQNKIMSFNNQAFRMCTKKNVCYRDPVKESVIGQFRLKFQKHQIAAPDQNLKVIFSTQTAKWIEETQL